jgi:EAL domain-containing protein (putative c-di-GMP-specific phosphodiesterase class I)
MEAAMRLGHERGLMMSGVLPKPIRIEKLREMLNGFRKISKEQLSADLAEALASDELFLEYQPKFDCTLRKYTGVEALVRWHHNSHGVIRPDEFIALAEETGLIHKLTDHVVANAARQAAQWHSENLLLEVAVNISAHDVEDLNLPERLYQHCKEARLDPDAIILELTETGAMRQAVQMMDVLTRLRIKGFRLSIDDFGTGYSSLVQLERLPFSELKIDQSFVAHMLENSSCRVIAGIVTDLARKLGLKSVAEGVEDYPTLVALAEMGCDMAQGFYLSRPLPGDQVVPFVREQLANPAFTLPARQPEP